LPGEIISLCAVTEGTFNDAMKHIAYAEMPNDKHAKLDL
jgi:hypothetical protein